MTFLSRYCFDIYAVFTLSLVPFFHLYLHICLISTATLSVAPIFSCMVSLSHLYLYHRKPAARREVEGVQVPDQRLAGPKPRDDEVPL